MATYSKEGSAWFFSKDDPRWELSNMAGGMPIYWPLERREENKWGSSEGLYQATKYSSLVECLPETTTASAPDPNVRRRIQWATNPRGAKMTQKCAVKAGLVRPDWQLVNLDSMRWVLELKLYHNPRTFGRVLLSTGDKPIVEVSRKDDFWGCVEVGSGTLVGHNHLGRLLDDLRGRHDEVVAGKFSSTEGYLLP